MIPESKGLNPHKLAHRWGLLTPTSYNADTKNIKAIIPWLNSDKELIYLSTVS